jgi:AraC-like DNA-binding protein
LWFKSTRRGSQSGFPPAEPDRPVPAIDPKGFRLESRTRLAWREIVRSTASLTDIALNLGFSDLPHLSRSIHVFTGRSPSGWRTVRS